MEKKIAPMHVRVIIHAQYEENYGFYEGKQAWKFKGGSQFVFDVSDGMLMYGEEEIIAWVKAVLLPQHSNEVCRFTFVSLEKKFDTPIDCQNEWDAIKETLFQKAS